MKNKWILIICLIFVITTLVSCKTADILTGNEVPNKEWDLIEASALDSTINIVTTYSDEKMRGWLNGKFADTLTSNYGITLIVKTLNFDDVVTTLQNEALNEVGDGSIDLLLLKDDEFTKLLNLGYLYEAISSKVPNFSENINNLQVDIQTEHGTPLDGYAVPFGREQFVLSFDEDILEVFPTTLEELLQFVKENEDTFAYANPQTENTGGEFVRTVIYDVVGPDNMLPLMSGDWSEEAVESLIMPGIEFLKLLDPYIRKNDGQYFKKQDDIDQLYKEGELYFSMNSGFSYIEDAVKDEFYPDGAKSFIFENGTICDTTYLAIPMNAANKTGALVAINEVISVDLQLNKYIPSNYGNLPVFDLNIMSDSDVEQFSKASVKRNTLRVEDLYEKRFYELPIDIQVKINNIWNRHINMQ